MPTIDFSLEEITSKRAIIRHKLNGHRWKLERSIEQYVPKMNAGLAYKSLERFFAVQDIVYNKCKKTVGENLAFSLGTKVAALEQYRGSHKSSFFDNKKVNLDRSFPQPVNDMLDLCTEALDRRYGKDNLEDVVDAFFFWAKEDSEKVLKTEEIKDIKIRIEGKDCFKKGKLTVGNSEYSIDRFIIKSEDLAKQAEFISGHKNVKLAFNDTKSILENMAHCSKYLDTKNLLPNYIMHGPPGTGKTTLAYTLANNPEIGFAFISCPEVLSKYFSESAKNLVTLYNSAEEAISSGKYNAIIMFLEEVDPLAKQRGSTNSGESDNIVSTLLECTQRNGRRSGKVITISTTNYLDGLDRAFVSRNAKLEVAYPISRSAIIDIHKNVVAGLQDYASSNDVNLTDIDFNDIESFQPIIAFSDKNDEYKSGRFIKHAYLECIKKNVLSSIGAEYAPVTVADLVCAYKSLLPIEAITYETKPGYQVENVE